MPGIATSSTTASWRDVGQPVQRLAAVGRELDLVAVEAQRAVQRGAHRGLVVDDQNARHSAQSRIKQ